MTTKSIRRNNYDFSGQGPLLMMCLIIAALLITQSLVQGIDQTNETGVSGDHANHEDTITTPLPGNCPNCSWPDCGGCNGEPVITLEPTVFITSLPTFDPATTPVIPQPANGNVTVFPTLAVDDIPGVPTAIGVSTLIPTGAPGSIPTIEPPASVNQ